MPVHPGIATGGGAVRKTLPVEVFSQANKSRFFPICSELSKPNYDETISLFPERFNNHPALILSH